VFFLQKAVVFTTAFLFYVPESAQKTFPRFFGLKRAHIELTTSFIYNNIKIKQQDRFSNKMRTLSKGLTLVELMVVVGVILLIAAIAIPNILRARVSGQEAAAAKAMQTIVAAEVQYRATNPIFGTLAQLGAAVPAYVDSNLASGSKQGYNFVVVPNVGTDFYATATPQDINASHTFYIDEDGILCRSNATGTAAPAAHIGPGCPAAFGEVQ
jgi:prepilin-type N-terminal cleavage/methylation domain-containing protein